MAKIGRQTKIIGKTPKPIPTFGRQRGRRLRTGPARLMEELFPKLAILLPHPDALLKGEGILNPTALFPDQKETWLEIGFGGGEHLAHLARHHPDVGFIGCEVFRNGVASLLGHVEKHNLENVRIIQGDVRQLLEALTPHSLARIYIFHPDPWPKSRHHKRRLISPDFITLLRSRLRSGGSVKVATDWPDYADWILKHFRADQRFCWTAPRGEDCTARFSESCMTRYETKARAEGRNPVYFEFIAA